ncbi:MAG: amidohydrolase [Akkermansia sp.]
MPQTHCDLLLHADHILTNNQESDLWNNASIAIQSGKIVAIGAREEIEQSWVATQIKNMGDSLLMPGLINAHTHVPMTFLRGFADDLPLMDWLTKHIFPVEAHLTKEIVALGSRWGMYEMMRTGTTSFVDSYLLEDQVLSTADTMGMRCVAGEVIFAFPSPAYANWDAAADLYRAQVAQYKDNNRIQLAVMPHSVYTTNDQILRQSMKLAEELDLMLHMHLSESQGEVDQSLDLHHGQRPIAYANNMGLLNPRTFMAHMVAMTDDEIATVATTGTHIIHNPASNFKLASGFAPITQMRRAGISVGLGTDGAASNNTLDMFETLKMTALVAKAVEQDATVIPAQEALNMATVESARIFRTPGLGTLKVGSPADIIALDMTEPNLCPLYHPLSHVVYAASGKDCILTVVDGKILYERGSYADGLYDDTRKAIKDIVAWAKSKAAQ